tara:strand:+ start:4340 stop:5746 length:1407 start_codon:yes stop_codon:yes gene_type:complete
MSNLELNIREYAHEDLLGLFGINNPHLDNIQEKYRAKMTKVGQMEDKALKKNLESFLNQAYIAIIDKKNEEKSNTVTSHDIIKIEEPSTNSTFSLKYPLGNINPIKRKTTTQLISIDSLFRNLKLYPQSTDFIVNLPNPIENAINMKLVSAEIPNSFSLYSEERGNNKLTISMQVNQIDVSNVPLVIVIIDGSPSFLTLIGYINDILDSQRNAYSFLICGIDNISGKLFFRFKTVKEMRTWTTVWYDGGGTSVPPDNKPPTYDYVMPGSEPVSDATGLSINEGYVPGTSEKETWQHNIWDASMANVTYKIDFNPGETELIKSLGWAMGFREPTSWVGFADTFERGFITYHGYLAGNTPYSDAEDDYIFLYIDDFVGNYNDNLSSALGDDNFFSKSLIARIKISSAFYMVEFVENAGTFLEKTRDYFGPVNIKKLHFKLINKFGGLIDLMNSNFSLTLEFEKLYSSVRN